MRMWKNMVQPERLQMTLYYRSCTLHAGYLRPQTYTQNVLYLLLFYSTKSYVIVSHCYICTYIAHLVHHHQSFYSLPPLAFQPQSYMDFIKDQYQVR